MTYRAFTGDKRSAALVLLCVFLAARTASAQSTQSVATTTAATTVPATQASTQPAAAGESFALPQLARRIESTTTLLKRVDADLAADRAVSAIDDQIESLASEIAARLQEGEDLSAGHSLDELRSLERDWSGIRSQLREWSSELARRAAVLSADEDALRPLADAWQRTLADAGAVDTAGAELAGRVEAIARQVADARARVANHASQVKALQARVTVQDVRAAEALSAVRAAQAAAVDHLIDRDAEPLWTGRLGAEAHHNISTDSRHSLARQWSATTAYARRYPLRFVLHGALVALLAVGAKRVRRRWGEKLEADPATARSANVFRMPTASAIVATLPLVPWLYPQAPRLLLAAIGAALLVPAILVLRRLVLRPVRPLLYALAIFYVLGLLVSVTGSMPALSRTLFLLTMIGGVALLAQFLYRTPRSKTFSDFGNTRHWKLIQFAVRVALVLMTASALANVFGFVGLSRLLGDGVLVSAYVAIMLDACVRVAHALLAASLHAVPAGSVRILHRQGPLIVRRMTILLACAAGVWWLVITLDAFSVRQPLFGRLYRILDTHWGYGAVDLSLGGILAFVAAVLASFLVSRFVRFVLAEDVYPRLHLPRGIPYAISTLLNYAILFVGFLLAVAALGYDMTKFTILAGAFGVGLGFGMQNIVNNFVSGLILLFERPIQVGDVIELDAGVVGAVSRIGIRASIVRTTASAEIIVPNALLISSRVTNWTLSNRQRGFDIPVAVAAGNDPKAVTDLLVRVAAGVPAVASTPAPEAYVTEFLPGGGLKFELRVWTDRFDDWTRARSEVVSAVDRELPAAGIQRV